jgi:hypothetical protein
MTTTADIVWLLIEGLGLVMWIAAIWMAVELLQGIVQ